MSLRALVDAAGARSWSKLDGDPQGVVETVADAAGLARQRVRANLERFKRLIEEQGEASGAWRGEVRGTTP